MSDTLLVAKEKEKSLINALPSNGHFLLNCRGTYNVRDLKLTKRLLGNLLYQLLGNVKVKLFGSIAYCLQRF